MLVRVLQQPSRATSKTTKSTAVAAATCHHGVTSTWSGLAVHAGAAPGSARGLYKGHLAQTLEKLRLPRHQWLKEVDQAPPLHSVRQQKDKYLRELGVTHKSFTELHSGQKEYTGDRHDPVGKTNNVNEALRMYRLLRPDAPAFYEEDAMISMKARLNREISQGTTAHSSPSALTETLGGSDPFKSMQASLPVVNQKAFLLALESVVASLADDLEAVLQSLGVDTSNIPSTGALRFKSLVDMLFRDAFPLKKDPSKAGEFVDEHWPRLSILLPPALADNKDVVTTWLEGHLRRVQANQARIRREDKQIFLHQTEHFGAEEYYSFAEDFPYDDDPMPGLLADERNLDFPLEQAETYMKNAMSYLSSTGLGSQVGSKDSKSEHAEIASQFQDLIWDLESIGLKNWLKMDTQELDRYLPRGIIEAKDWRKDPEINDLRSVAQLMLRCAARGKANLLDFEAVDPHQLLHGFPAQGIQEELDSLPENPHMADGELVALVDNFLKRGLPEGSEGEGRLWHDEKSAGIEEVFAKELNFYRNAGPVEWVEPNDDSGQPTGEWSWRFRQPPNTIWDARRGVYIPEQSGINPNLRVREMRQVMLQMTRMGSMYKNGRLFYFRCIVAVGDGQGIYGFGVGFGNTPKEARSDASLKALQNLDYIDVDTGRTLCHPCRGQEYSQQVYISPRPLGKGIRANKKMMPLIYILGLDNCRVRFFAPNNRWFTRIRGLKRALDMMISRRTLANMTGKKHAMLVAPGDHWVHWPDAWFDQTSKEYHAKATHIRMLRKMILKGGKRGRSGAAAKNRSLLASSLETRHGWRLDKWKRWVNPVETWWTKWDTRQELTNKPDLAGSSDGALPWPPPFRSAVVREDVPRIASPEAEVTTPPAGAA